MSRIEIHDGRQTEQDVTETGSCTVFINDQDGIFDPANTGSPFYGKIDGIPVAIAIWNPVSSAWVPQWRGTVDDIRSDLNPNTSGGVSINSNIQLECVDIFDYLAGAKFRIGGRSMGFSGDVPPPGSEGIIFYEDETVDDRIIALLDDAGIDPDMYTVFSGNVYCTESQYDPEDTFITGLRDAADAEFPGIANVYVDKLGRVVFHGRFARLDPDDVAAEPGVDWDFTRWKVGDGAAIALDSDRAQLREFSWARSRSRIVNSAIAYPAGTDETDIPGQLVEDLTSIGRYGIHSRADINLQLLRHVTNSDTGLEQALKYSQFWTTYYKDPLTRIERIIVKSLDPGDSRAAATWSFLTGVSISDIVNVSVGTAGGEGIQDTNYYVEGRDITIEPLRDYDLVTLSLNISPAITDTDEIFGPFGG